jgi:hypothetical protein
MKIHKLSSDDRHFLRQVLSPSWLSGLIIILAGLVVTGGAITTFSLSHSAFKQDLIDWEHAQTKSSIIVPVQSSETSKPTIANSWSLIVVWGFVGLFTYAIAASIIRFILETMAFRRQMDYVHANPRSMLKNAIEHIVMRLMATGLLAMLVLLSIHRILPYAINASGISATHILSVKGIWYALISFIVTTLCIYVGSILLRLMFGRARLFSSN